MDDGGSKPNCVVTFRNDGAVDIIIEPENESENFERAVLVPSGQSNTTHLFASSYIITLYSAGYENTFSLEIQRRGVSATSAHINVGFDDGTKKFSWKVDTILRGDAPLFPQEEMGSNTTISDDEDSGPPLEFDEADLSDNASDVESNEGPELRYKLLDIAFVLDVTAGHGAFLSSTFSAIKSALREFEISQAFRTRAFRAALVVTRENDGGGFELERNAFTSSLNRFEADLDGVEVDGRRSKSCAFNVGLGEALGPDMGWRTGAMRLVIVATAGIPHAIGEKIEHEDDRYAVSLSDPIRMARRMSLLGIDLAFLTDVDLVNSNDFREYAARFVLLLRFVAYGVFLFHSGAGVYQTGDPNVIWNYIASAMPSDWSAGNATRARELEVSDAVQRSSAYQHLNKIYSEAHTLTSEDVRDALEPAVNCASVIMVRPMAFARVTFTNSGKTQIGIQCRDSDREILLKEVLGPSSSASASVATHENFSYVLSTTKKKKELTDRTSSDKSIDVSKKI
ncbi:hypothetical protein EIP86_001134 [Pleurotus ostreatoroseus]|nr:hypothetical protein EIP86_001134 [Pleurotus ostreatoroseus]